MSWSVISGSSSISSQVSITWWRQFTVECFHRWHKIRSIRHYETAGAVSRSFWFFFSCDQAALWMVFSVRLSVCHTFLAATKQLYEWYFLSVCLSVCPSHLFDYVPIIASSWNFQELSPRTRVTSMQKVKVIGQRSIENYTPSFSGFYPNLTLAVVGLSSETFKLHKKMTVVSEHVWDYEIILKKNAMSLQCRYLCKFPASSILSSTVPQFSAQGGAGGTPWGPGVLPASAESCTHPAKRDRCFPPPIAER